MDVNRRGRALPCPLVLLPTGGAESHPYIIAEPTPTSLQSPTPTLLQTTLKI